MLADLEKVPTPKEKPNERNNQPQENKNQLLGLSELEKEIVKRCFVKNKIKKISLKNDELTIKNNNNEIEIISKEQLNNSVEYQLVKDSLQKSGNSELTSSELGLNIDNNSTNTDNSP